MAASGELTDESKSEQAAAGLDTMSAEEKDKLRSFNEQYKEKFGFPFVICARRNKKEAILKGIQQRLTNSRVEEIRTGIAEVKKICALRLLKIVSEDESFSRL